MRCECLSWHPSFLSHSCDPSSAVQSKREAGLPAASSTLAHPLNCSGLQVPLPRPRGQKTRARAVALGAVFWPLPPFDSPPLKCSHGRGCHCGWGAAQDSACHPCPTRTPGLGPQRVIERVGLAAVRGFARCLLRLCPQRAHLPQRLLHGPR